MSVDIYGLVVRATDPNNVSEDWEAILQITDILCQNPDDYTDNVIKTLSNRLKDDNSITKLYSITLLDAILKNTNDYVKQRICNPEFLNLIQKLTKSGDENIKQKSLDLIKENKLNITHNTPPPFVPQGSSNPYFQQQQQGYNGPIGSGSSLNTTTNNTTTSGNNVMSNNNNAVRLSPYKQKLESDLKIVRENMSLLMQLVEAANSPKELKEDDTAIQVEVNCKEMKNRIIGLIELVPEETVLLKLIDIHDQLNDILECFSKFMKSGKKELPNNLLGTKPIIPNDLISAPPLESQSPHNDMFGSLANRNTKTGGVTTNNNLLSLDDFLAPTTTTTTQPMYNIPPQTTYSNNNSNPNVMNTNRQTNNLQNNNNVNTNKEISLDELLLGFNSPVNTNNNNQYDFIDNSNPYQDSMASEFARIGGNNNNMYPQMDLYNPYSNNPYDAPPTTNMNTSNQGSNVQANRTTNNDNTTGTNSSPFANLANRKTNK
ncbi:hypothetical protein ABK040_001271 [Willaertia magna]